MYGKAIVFTSCRLWQSRLPAMIMKKEKRCPRQAEAAFSDLSKISIAGLFRME